MFDLQIFNQSIVFSQVLTTFLFIFLDVAQPYGDYKPEDVATVGELLLDISINLARTYVSLTL